MWIPTLLFLLFVAGCGYAAKSTAQPKPEPEPEPPPNPERKRYGTSFAVDVNDGKLYEAVAKAVAAWNLALGGEWATIKDDGDVPVFWVETVDGEGCPVPTTVEDGYYLSGCAVAVAGPDTHIQVSVKIPDERLNGIVLHEMGHVLRAAGGHIDHPDSGFPPNEHNVMNHKGDASAMISPTVSDAAFIWQGMRYDYSQT